MVWFVSLFTPRAGSRTRMHTWQSVGYHEEQPCSRNCSNRLDGKQRDYMPLFEKAGNQKGKKDREKPAYWLKVFCFLTVRLYIAHVIAITFQNNFIFT